MLEQPDDAGRTRGEREGWIVGRGNARRERTSSYKYIQEW